MREQSPARLIADLMEAADIQAKLTDHRLLLEWGETLLRESRCVWDQIEKHEALAYEDKVGAQIRVTQEVSLSLWHLYKQLARTHRQLKGHRQRLRVLKGGA